MRANGGIVLVLGVVFAVCLGCVNAPTPEPPPIDNSDNIDNGATDPSDDGMTDNNPPNLSDDSTPDEAMPDAGPTDPSDDSMTDTISPDPSDDDMSDNTPTDPPYDGATDVIDTPIRAPAVRCSAQAPYDTDDFSCIEAGQLLPGSSIAGGSVDTTIWIPNMRFPLRDAPAFINSQVYRYGGGGLSPSRLGPDGNPFGAETWQCDARNYSFPWQDNFCESRGYETDFCPSGTGHQGLDIRDAVCQGNRNNRSDDMNIVAVADGVITRVQPHSTRLRTDGGAIVDYLHMKNEPGQRAVERADLDLPGNEAGVRVVRGQPLGSVGRILNSRGVLTTYHLHIEVRIPIRDDVTGTVDWYPVPMYETMKEAYLRLEAGNP